MPQGSPFWQGVILLVAALFLFWEARRGWKNGVVRSGLNLAALVLASIIGYMAARAAAAPFGGFSDLGGLITGVLTGIGVALVILFIIWILGAVLFKRTEHQESGLVRFFWGLGGAFFGILMGLIFICGAITMIRGLGALGQARLQSQPSTATTPGVPSANAPDKPPAIANAVVTLKESLELGPVGQIVEQVDPIPEDVYVLISDAARVVNDPSLLNRMVEYPGIQQMMQHPKIAALLSDPAVVKAAEERNIMALISNKTMVAAAQDPELSKELSQIDIRAALKFALEKPATSPSPSQFPNKK